MLKRTFPFILIFLFYLLIYKNFSSIGSNKNIINIKGLLSFFIYCFLSKLFRIFNFVFKLVIFKKENNISFTLVMSYSFILLLLKNFFNLVKYILLNSIFIFKRNQNKINSQYNINFHIF